MELTIQASAKLMKVGRSTIYKKIESGELSKTGNGKIETSELYRVFGSPTDRVTRQEEKTHIDELKTLSAQDTKQLQDTFEKEALYKAQIKTLEEALTHAQERERQHLEREAQHLEREQWQRKHIETLTETIKLLEPPKPEVKKVGFFSRLFGKKV